VTAQQARFQAKRANSQERNRSALSLATMTCVKAFAVKLFDGSFPFKIQSDQQKEQTIVTTSAETLTSKELQKSPQVKS